MQSYEFTGYVEEVSPKTNYDLKFILCDVKDPNGPSVKYPQSIQFKINIKNESMIGVADQMGIGDKVKVRFYPWCKKGISKKTGSPYCITENNVGEIQIVEAAPKPTSAAAEDTSEDGEADDLPF